MNRILEGRYIELHSDISRARRTYKVLDSSRYYGTPNIFLADIVRYENLYCYTVVRLIYDFNFFNLNVYKEGGVGPTYIRQAEIGKALTRVRVKMKEYHKIDLQYRAISAEYTRWLINRGIICHPAESAVLRRGEILDPSAFQKSVSSDVSGYSPVL